MATKKKTKSTVTSAKPTNTSDRLVDAGKAPKPAAPAAPKASTNPAQDYLNTLMGMKSDLTAEKAVDKTIATESAADKTAAQQTITDVAKITTAATGTQFTPTVTPTSSTLDATSKDAYALMEAQFSQWGIPEAYTFFQNQLANNVGPNEAMVLLRQQDFYKQRFAGNIGRTASGKNALSESEYVALENQYSNLMTQYGVSNLANRSQFATLIGNDIAPTELNSRLDLAVSQVQQADPMVMQTLKQYYPNINTGDIVSYFLSPTEALPALQRKVQTADIGAAAAQQGLTTSLARAGEIAANNISYDQARSGYTQIAQELPVTNKLQDIYGVQSPGNFNQVAAEAEQFNLSGAASAARKREQLKQLEEAQFNGRSGATGTSLDRGLQGKF